MTNTPQEEWIKEFDENIGKCYMGNYESDTDEDISKEVKSFISQEKDKSYRQGVEECIENVARLVTKKDVHTFGDLTDSLCEKFNLK